jgi:hypothetical protein
MRSLRAPLRALIAAGSLAGFFGGWILLAHAPKPVQSDSNAPRIQLSGPEVDFSAPPGLQLLPGLPQSPGFAFPRLRTGGS